LFNYKAQRTPGTRTPVFDTFGQETENYLVKLCVRNLVLDMFFSVILSLWRQID
jgi:hypothetical protein